MSWVLSIDLWGTLITYGDREAEAAWRVREFHTELIRAGHDVDTAAVDGAVRRGREELLDQQRRTGLQVPVERQVAYLLEMIGVPADPELVRVLVVPHTHAVLRACPAMITGAHAALRHARTMGARIFLNSNTLATPASVTRQILDSHHLTALLDGGVYSSQVGFAKPRPEMFQALALAAGVPVSEIVHVGNDWRTDVQGALEAGCQAVWFNPRGRPPRPPVLAITSLTQMGDAAAAALGLTAPVRVQE